MASSRGFLRRSRFLRAFARHVQVFSRGSRSGPRLTKKGDSVDGRAISAGRSVPVTGRM